MKKIIMILISVTLMVFAAGNKNVTNVTDANFQKEVLESKLPVLVDFWAPWCGPCRTLGPIIEELANENFTKMKFVKMNVDENNKIAGSFGIRSIPTVIIFKDGKKVDSFIGLRGKQEIKAIITKHFIQEKTEAKAVPKEESIKAKPAEKK